MSLNYPAAYLGTLRVLFRKPERLVQRDYIR